MDNQSDLFSELLLQIPSQTGVQLKMDQFHQILLIFVGML